MKKDKIEKENEFERKKRDEENAKVMQRKENFYSSLNNLRKLLEQIITIKNNFSKGILDCQNIIELINQKIKDNKSKNLQNLFMANDIKNINNNLNFLISKKNKLEKHINFLNHKINQLNQLNNSYNLIQEDNNINFSNDIIYNEKINNIKKLEDEIKDAINNTNLINENLIITKINSEIQNIVDFPLVIIGDSFYNKKKQSG